MRRLFFGIWVLATSVAPLAAAGDGDPRIAKALERLNAIRKEIGVAPVELDAKIAAGCQAHAKYLVANPDIEGLQGHDEDPKRPGFTEEGKMAAARSVIYPSLEPLQAMDGWIGGFYHRVDLISPELKKIGIGFAPSKMRIDDWSVVDVFTGRVFGSQKEPLFYPGPDQKDVPRLLVLEVPDPIPDAKNKAGGFPITVTFGQEVGVKNAAAKLTVDGKEVPVWLSSPEKPANPMYPMLQKNTICLIPKEPLLGGKSYSVTVSATVSGKEWTKSWQFTTRKK
jgi:hypothetical protein